MPEKYLHYFGNESSESLLEAYGLKPAAQELNKLSPIICPNCGEGNSQQVRFCAKCRMILSYNTYLETLEEKENKQSEVKTLSEKYEIDMKEMRVQMKYIVALIQENPKLANVKTEVLGEI